MNVTRTDRSASEPAGPGRWAEVAVDAAGPAGGQTFTYAVPPELAELSPGEAVLVEYGRRRALGVVLELSAVAPERATKPILARVRSDGPLLTRLQVQLARHIADHYLAPPALVVRQMLAPGALERVERVTTAGEAGPVSEWRVRAPVTRERLERWVRLSGTTEGPAGGGGAGGGAARLGPRQRALLAELEQAGEPLPGARLAGRHGAGVITRLARRGLIELETVRVERRPLAGRPEPARGTRPLARELTAAQRQALARIEQPLRARRHETILLEGVTASGKSAVYAAAIAAALAQGRGALVLVPEIALAVPLLERLQYDLGPDVALLHSGLSDGERADEARRLRAGEVSVVLGTRLAVLAPLADPGVIIVDEEHDAAYKSDRTPRYQARDLAVVLGRLAGAPVVLGSATPDVVTLGRAQMGEVNHLRLPRVAGSPASVHVVDLRAELSAGVRGMLSRALADALGALDTAAGEQAILLINRRGSASVVICRDCGYVQICPECQRPLVFHAAALALRCHHCGAGAPVARRCPACESVRIRYLGGGTQRVEREVELRFPTLRVGRLDRDVVERRGAAQRVVDAFAGGELDVLVGTSLVAKGLDVPQVTLVGVVSADIALTLPDERAEERTYQLLAQAVGRAGRGYRPGTAIIQTYLPHHPAIRAVSHGEAAEFYAAALATRRALSSPPFGSIIKLTVARDEREAAERDASEMTRRLRDHVAEAGTRVEVLGPVPAYVARRAGRWRFHVVLRGDRPREVLGGDPGPPWSVDVDPESLL
ncbi:MAG TPA: primosomal protein N' [Candidatus Limnocylindria bacterium]|nr:primosomal protein N' [Candidatus Limnocylindria bacterium]